MKYHMCLDLRGALRNMNKRQLGGLLMHDDGRSMTAHEAHEAILDEIAKGHKVIPCADCDNFDYQHGCQGHPEIPENKTQD